jgi:multidrug efflux pump
VRLRDIARIELGAADYALRSLLDNKPAVAIPIFQAPGSNALDISTTGARDHGRAGKGHARRRGLRIVYDPTQFVRAVHQGGDHHAAGSHAAGGAGGHLFLQTWRASIIPLLAVPVSIIGTFA